ncbi:MAG: hypothetical protein ACREC8_03860 [Limisphaerales bacterium]
MPTAVAIWVWFCAYLNCAGWVLSAIHQLNPRGYAVTLLIWLAALAVWKIKTPPFILSRPLRGVFGKWLHRFRRPFPLAFLILTTMAFLGGAIYPPTNYDALAYRLPRILHWLAAGQWHWIHTIFDRVNDRSCGIEWVSAPFIAVFKTDRFLFLINIVSFLFLPGLVFSVFIQLGVRRRVAWRWMWIVPTGYCLLLQAGSIGNDLFGATFALAAVDFALRTKNSRSAGDFFTSILAAAMMTSAKTGNLPLLLPWAIAILPSWKMIFVRRPFLSASLPSPPRPCQPFISTKNTTTIGRAPDWAKKQTSLTPPFCEPVLKPLYLSSRTLPRPFSRRRTSGTLPSPKKFRRKSHRSFPS